MMVVAADLSENPLDAWYVSYHHNMRIRVGRVRRLVAGGMGAGILIAGVLMSPAAADNQDQGPPVPPDPKVTDASQWSLPLDVTGDADASAKRDRSHEALKSVAAYDGGLLWEGSTQTVTIQMTTDAALQQARNLVAETKTGLQVEFALVKYSAKELEDLSRWSFAVR